MKRGFLAVAVFALAVPMSAAAADNPFAKEEAMLRLNGLDLSTPEGQQRLALRMDAAARTVCGDRLSTVHLAAEERARECRTEVLADIRDQIEARTGLAAKGAATQLASAR